MHVNLLLYLKVSTLILKKSAISGKGPICLGVALSLFIITERATCTTNMLSLYILVCAFHVSSAPPPS